MCPKSGQTVCKEERQATTNNTSETEHRLCRHQFDHGQCLCGHL